MRQTRTDHLLDSHTADPGSGERLFGMDLPGAARRRSGVVHGVHGVVWHLDAGAVHRSSNVYIDRQRQWSAGAGHALSVTLGAEHLYEEKLPETA